MNEIQAEGVGPVLGDAGPTPEFHWNGKTWKIGHPIQRAKAELESLVCDYVFRHLEAMRGVWPEAKFAAKEAELELQVLGGHHRTWGSLWRSVTSGPDGNALFLLALLRVHAPATTLAEASVLWNASPRQLRIAYAAVIPGFFAHLVSLRPGTTEEKAATLATVVAGILESLGVEHTTPATPSV